MKYQLFLFTFLIIFNSCTDENKVRNSRNNEYQSAEEAKFKREKGKKEHELALKKVKVKLVDIVEDEGILKITLLNPQESDGVVNFLRVDIGYVLKIYETELNKDNKLEELHNLGGIGFFLKDVKKSGEKLSDYFQSVINNPKIKLAEENIFEITKLRKVNTYDQMKEREIEEEIGKYPFSPEKVLSALSFDDYRNIKYFPGSSTRIIGRHFGSTVNNVSPFFIPIRKTIKGGSTLTIELQIKDSKKEYEDIYLISSEISAIYDMEKMVRLFEMEHAIK